MGTIDDNMRRISWTQPFYGTRWLTACVVRWALGHVRVVRIYIECKPIGARGQGLSRSVFLCFF